MTTYLRKGAKIMGFKNWENFVPHSLRGYFISKMANNGNVSDIERMRSSRHSNPKTSVAYQSRSATTEVEKFRSLGLSIPTADLSTTTRYPTTVTVKSDGVSTKKKENCTVPTNPTIKSGEIYPKCDSYAARTIASTLSEKFSLEKSESQTIREYTATPTTVLNPIRLCKYNVPLPTPTTTSSTTSNPCAYVPRIRGGSTENNQDTNDQYEYDSLHDKEIPHTQLAVEECNHDIRKLECSLSSTPKPTKVSTTAVRVIQMADKVQKLTKLVKELNEKVVMYKDMLYNKGLEESTMVLNDTTNTCINSRSTPHVGHNSTYKYTQQQKTVPAQRVTNPYKSVPNPYLRRRLTPSNTHQRNSNIYISPKRIDYTKYQYKHY